MVSAALVTGFACTLTGSPTTRESDETREVFVTVAAHPDGSPKRILVERTLEPAGNRSSVLCDVVLVKRYDFTPAGVLLRRTSEQQRCGVTELRLVDLYPESGSEGTREAFQDDDADGEFDSHTVRVLSLDGVPREARALPDPAVRRCVSRIVATMQVQNEKRRRERC